MPVDAGAADLLATERAGISGLGTKHFFAAFDGGSGHAGGPGAAHVSRAGRMLGEAKPYPAPPCKRRRAAAATTIKPRLLIGRK